MRSEMQDATLLKNSICQITGFHEYLRMKEEGKKINCQVSQTNYTCRTQQGIEEK